MDLGKLQGDGGDDAFLTCLAFLFFSWLFVGLDFLGFRFFVRVVCEDVAAGFILPRPDISSLQPP